jgi:hypothetical protein
VDAGSEAGDEEDGEENEQEGDDGGGACARIADFAWSVGFGDGDSEDAGCDEAKGY